MLSLFRARADLWGCSCVFSVCKNNQQLLFALGLHYMGSVPKKIDWACLLYWMRVCPPQRYALQNLSSKRSHWALSDSEETTNTFRSNIKYFFFHRVCCILVYFNCPRQKLSRTNCSMLRTIPMRGCSLLCWTPIGAKKYQPKTIGNVAVIKRFPSVGVVCTPRNSSFSHSQKGNSPHLNLTNKKYSNNRREKMNAFGRFPTSIYYPTNMILFARTNLAQGMFPRRNRQFKSAYLRRHQPTNPYDIIPHPRGIQ